VRGGLVAGLLFVLPGAVVITALSAIYLVAGNVPLVEGLLFGMKAAVLAIVFDALIRIAKRALKDRTAVAVAVAAFAAIALLKLPFPLIIVAAALFGAVMNNGQRPVEADVGIAATRPGPTLAGFAGTVVIWTAVWFAPLALLIPLLGTAHVYVAEAGFFSKVAMVTFGGAYAVLAYVAQQAVDIHHWLMPDEMLTGIGLAETTPGPLILVLVFVGFLGGARLSGFDPIIGGLGGAAITLWFTFVPCFLWIFAGAPYVETVRNIGWLTSALAAVTAAVVGVIANLALWFGLHVLFGAVGEIALGPFVLPQIDWARIDILAAAIAVLAAVALIRFKANMLGVLATAMIVGMAFSLA
jgi:chromate transporter